MTHDELQDAINTQIMTAPPFALGGYTGFLQALSAVVELHGQVGVVCGWCTCYDCDHIAMYPCKTIRAIQGVLE